jgi:ATP-binding cassette subfamily B protein
MTPRVRDVFAFAWRHWRRRPWLLLVLTLGIAGATLAEISGPLFVGRLVDALAAADGAAAMTALALVLGLRVLFHLCHKGGDYLWCGLAIAIMRQIGADAFARVQRYSAQWHAETFAGATVRKITRGLWAFDNLGDALYYHLLPSAAVVLGVVAVMAWRWPAMGLLFGLGAFAYGALSIWLSIAYFAPLRRTAVASDSQLGGVIADAITCNALVKSSGAERREERRLAGVLDHWHATMGRAWRASIHISIIQAALMVLLQLGLLGVAFWLWRQGAATAGDVAYVLTSFMLVNGYLRDVGQHIRVVQQAVNDIEDVVAYALTPPQILDRPGATRLQATAGAIRFENVRFAYPSQGQPVFEGLTVAIRPGERIALVGRSGSGKSTFVKLLQRLYELDGGRITIDGQDIATVTQASLRAAVALVPQEPALFHRSLAENIAYGRPDASAAAIAAAAAQAHAAAFIEALPARYDTLVGERGVKLSGGERQRIAIARALLAERPILVLDEATSSLDSVSEQAIQAALATLMAGRTTIVIAHRLSTIRQVDRILVFERGRIVEQGSHGELLARPGGRYQALYETQAGGFLAEAG